MANRHYPWCICDECFPSRANKMGLAAKKERTEVELLRECVDAFTFITPRREIENLRERIKVCLAAKKERTDGELIDWLQRNRMIMSIILRYVHDRFDVRTAINTAIDAGDQISNNYMRDKSMDAEDKYK